jgi:hypothetical protein
MNSTQVYTVPLFALTEEYNKGYNEGYRKCQQDMQIKLDQSCRDAYQEGLWDGRDYCYD